MKKIFYAVTLVIIVFLLGIMIGNFAIPQYLGLAENKENYLTEREIADLQKYEEKEKKLVEISENCIKKAEAELYRINDYSEDDSLGDDLRKLEIQNHIDNAVYYGMLATDLNPNNSELWFRRGNIYQELIDIVGGAREWALKCYKKALELDPDNQNYSQKLEKFN